MEYARPSLKRPNPATTHLKADLLDPSVSKLSISIQPAQPSVPIVSDEQAREYCISIVGHLFSLIGLGSERSDSSGDESDNPERDEAFRIFNCKHVPSIDLGDYVWRIVRYLDAWAGTNGVSGAGVRCALMAVEYLDRAAANGIYLTLYNVHRLFMVACLAAMKWSEDCVISNAYFAQVAGIPLYECNAMETVFCSEVLKWKLSVSRDRLTVQKQRFSSPDF